MTSIPVWSGDGHNAILQIPNSIKKALAIHLSLGMLLGGLGVGIARGDEKNKPVYIDQRSEKQTTMVLPAEEFSLAPGAKNGFTLARASQGMPEPEAMIGETSILASSRDLGFLVTLPFTEPLVQVYQTVPWDMMPNALGKGMKDAQATEKKSPWWKWPLIIIGTAAVGYGAYKLFFEKSPPPPPPPNPDYTVTINVINHRLGPQKTLTRTGKQGTQVTISPADWSDITNINQSYWAVRENNFGKYMADFKDSSATHTITIPGSNIMYEVYGANSTNNAPYVKITDGYAQAFLGRNVKWKFLQGNQEGSKDIYVTAINQIRQAIRPSWGPAYGELTAGLPPIIKPKPG